MSRSPAASTPPPRCLRRSLAGLVCAAVVLLVGADAGAQRLSFGIRGDTLDCGQYKDIQAIVWYGREPRMSIERLAAYCAPVLWFSPDEPLLMGRSGKDITIPEPFPFEAPSATPIVYYRVRSLQIAGQGAEEKAYRPESIDRGQSAVDLRYVAGIDLDFFFYYSSEVGLGVHQHDVESAQFQIIVWRRPKCKDAPYHLVVNRVIGKAHGVQWYDNTLNVDEYTRFPIHIMSEEGKHASCTDKNADGYFTPGYDVNRRINDAWGVRDVIRGGTLFTGGFESWMAKVRKPEHRVFPPLPEDSPLRERQSRGGVYAPDNAIYSLRTFPSADSAAPELKHFIADKGPTNWPDQVRPASLKGYTKWLDRESFAKSISAALYMDGDYGFSVAVPFFVVKNLEVPMTGGFLTQRLTYTNNGGADIAWMANYSASASRWIDGYVAGGGEWEEQETVPGGGTSRRSNVVIETGIKFRSSVQHSPLSFMAKLTDFWGLRLGVRNTGFYEISRLRYVIEIGAGTW